MRVGLIYDLFGDYPWRPGEPPDADAEYEPPETVAALAAALERLGHTVVRVGTAYQLRERLAEGLRLDAAVNITESAHSRNREAYAPILLEMAGIPCVGSDALTLSVSLDKAWTKDLVRAAGVRAPAHRVYPSAGAIDAGDLPGPFPLFVKPRYEGSAKGITPASRVEDIDALRRQVAWCAETYRQDALAEAFVGGAEFTVAVVGHAPPRALPVLQRAVEPRSRIGLHALEHRGMDEAGWDYVLEGDLTPELEAELHRLALRVFDVLDCRDFARLDFRVDAEGRPWFLEINTLPTFDPEGTFAIIAELMGRSYPDFLAEVLAGAFRRLGLG